MASKVILVTGASRGIGLAIVRILLDRGHKVFAAARSETELATLKARYDGHLEYLAQDLTGQEAVRENPASYPVLRIHGLTDMNSGCESMC